jgi:hypothetical protein
MIDFSRDYIDPQAETTKCGMCNRVVSWGGNGNKNTGGIACGDGFDDLKNKLANLSPSEAAELLEYLKTKGIE